MTDLPSEETRQQIKDFLSKPLDFPPEFKNWLTDWLGVNLPPIPISHISGYTSREAQGSNMPNETMTPINVGNTAENVWTDSPAGAPSISKLANGDFFCLYGGYFEGGADASQAWIGVSINGADPTEGFCQTQVMIDDGYYIMRGHVYTVASATAVNTLSLKFKWNRATSPSGDMQIGTQWMIVMRSDR